MSLSVPTPPAPKIPPPPRFSEPQIQGLAAEQRRKLLAGPGSGTSYLTGGLGVPGGSSSTGGAQLLGA
jgi:hypothetical protein